MEEDIDLYAHWELIPLKYKVLYIDKSTGKPLFSEKEVESPSFTPGQKITEDAVVIAGYIPYDSSMSLELDYDASKNQIVFEYEAKSNRTLKYTVEYVLFSDPSIHVAEDKHVEVSGTYASVTETAATITVPEYEDYHPMELTGTLQLGLNSESNILRFYYVPDGASVTVRWLDMDGVPIPGMATLKEYYKIGSKFRVDTQVNGYTLHHISDNLTRSGNGHRRDPEQPAFFQQSHHQKAQRCPGKRIDQAEQISEKKGR